MCNPAVIPYAIAAVSAYSSYTAGQEKKDASRYNARVLQNESTNTRNKGVDEENRHREKVQQLISKQRASSAANGVDINSGSILQAQDDAGLLGEVDALRIRSNFNDQADTLDTRADLQIREGNNAARAGTRNAVISLVGAAAGGVSSGWYNSASAANSAGAIE